jgi:hypothetical protein
MRPRSNPSSESVPAPRGTPERSKLRRRSMYSKNFPSWASSPPPPPTPGMADRPRRRLPLTRSRPHDRRRGDGKRRNILRGGAAVLTAGGAGARLVVAAVALRCEEPPLLSAGYRGLIGRSGAKVSAEDLALRFRLGSGGRRRRAERDSLTYCSRRAAGRAGRRSRRGRCPHR